MGEVERLLVEKKVFTQFEKIENLFERKYNGVPYWQMLRFMVCEDIYSNYIKNEDKVRAKNRKRRILLQMVQYPYESIKAILHLRNISNCDVLCFRNMGKHIEADRYFDTWTMPSEIKMQTIDISLEPAFSQTEHQYGIIAPYFKAQINYALKHLFRAAKRDEKEYVFLKELETKLKCQFGQEVSADRMEREIAHWSEFDRVFESFYEGLFDKTKCRAIIVDCYYNNFLYAAYRVAQKKGIRVIELQHGVISNHEEYWFEDQRGINNKTPDYFLAFGEAHISWTKLLSKTRALAMGFPFQERQIYEWRDLTTEDKTVVVYPQAEPDFERLIDEFANIAVQKGFRVILKLHPMQAIDPACYYPILINNKNIEIVAQQDKSIYYWLKLAKHHVMANTTVGLEAVALNHTNVCIATNVSHVQTQPLLEWGVARGFTTANELMELVEHPISNDCVEARNELWKPNAEQNIQMFFRNLKAQNWPEGKNFVS